MPIPEEVAIVFAGVVSSQGHLDPEYALAACLFGSLLGDSLMYAIGYHFGHGLMAKHPKLGKFVGAEREEYFEQAILRHGFKVMLLARFMVGVRGPVYLTTGVIRMPFRKFLLWDLICAILVVVSFFSLSYAYGKQITALIRNVELTFTLVVCALGLIAGVWWMRQRREKLVDEASDAYAEDGPLASEVSEVSDEKQPKTKTNSGTNREVT